MNRIANAEISELRDLLSKATQGKWEAGHLADDEMKCNCRYVFSEGHLGGIAEVYVDNGRNVSDGGNDCPEFDEAKANLALIVAMKNALPALLDEVESRRG
jgi:hypothetical protein